jgi:hypothetical protein
MMRPGARSSALFGILVVLVIAGFAIGAYVQLNVSSSTPPNSLAAEALYWKTLRRLVAQPSLQISETFRQRLPASMLPLRTPGTTFGMSTTTYRIRHTTLGGIDVLKTVRSPVSVLPFRVVLHGSTLCVGVTYQDLACSPVHPMSIPVYLADYLLGGQVGGLRFSQAPGTTRSVVTLIRISGQGALGCTPAYAGAGTKSGYRWCRPGDVHGGGTVSATLAIATATGTPIRFTATGTEDGQPNDVRADFSYGGSYVIRTGRVTHLPCLSWIPAVHCIELGHKNRGA